MDHAQRVCPRSIDSCGACDNDRCRLDHQSSFFQRCDFHRIPHCFCLGCEWKRYWDRSFRQRDSVWLARNHPCISGCDHCGQYFLCGLHARKRIRCKCWSLSNANVWATHHCQWVLHLPGEYVSESICRE